jgi:hypothetical protein
MTLLSKEPSGPGEVVTGGSAALPITAFVSEALWIIYDFQGFSTG